MNSKPACRLQMRLPPAADRSRRGMSLLEVILAIAILGGSMAVIGELVRIGSRCAATARDLTMAQILCESKLGELAAGALPPDPVEGAPADESGEWLYSVQSEPIDQAGLLNVAVTVQQNPDEIDRPVSFTLVRWIADPAAVPVDAAADDASAGSTGAAAGSASGNSSSSGGSSSGGSSQGGASGS